MAVQNPTTNFNWTLPVVGASVGTWGTLLNQILGDDGAGSLDSILRALDASWVTSGAFHVDRIPSLDAAKIGSGTFVNARIAAGNVTQHQAALSIATTQLTGNMPDARIIASNVTQHQASLSVATTQLTGNMPDARIIASNVTQHQASLSIAGSQISSAISAANVPNLSATKITTDTLVSSRGGTGVSAPTTGNLLVGAGASAMTALAPGTAGGFVRSNGSAWVRSTIQAADVPNLSATKITADEFNIARIPTITSAKVATDVAKVQISTGSPTGTPAQGTFHAQV
jgi:hypothetical protein